MRRADVLEERTDISVAAVEPVAVEIVFRSDIKSGEIVSKLAGDIAADACLVTVRRGRNEMAVESAETVGVVIQFRI